jgi:hypothetical protein
MQKQIPTINRDAPLVTRLLPIVIGGFDLILDKKSQLYFRLLCRLVDKSFKEYSIAKEHIDEEIKTKDKLAYRFSIIDHLENCINAIHNIFSRRISHQIRFAILDLFFS